MEELIQKIDELINEISANSVPLWLSIIGVFVPILLSLLVLWQGYPASPCDKERRPLQQLRPLHEELPISYRHQVIP